MTVGHSFYSKSSMKLALGLPSSLHRQGNSLSDSKWITEQELNPRTCDSQYSVLVLCHAGLYNNLSVSLLLNFSNDYYQLLCDEKQYTTVAKSQSLILKPDCLHSIPNSAMFYLCGFGQVISLNFLICKMGTIPLTS